MLRILLMKLYKNPRYQFAFFLIILFIINVLQSKYTKLFEDEAYYWVWSKNLSFGYFDHPPLVALWIKISSFFFEGELGVRFFSTISFSLMLILIWLMIGHTQKWKYVWLYFLLVISVALINAFGFVTTPDTPLFLFIALFLYAYQQFLKNNSWQSTLLLGFSMAAMLNSKYHGVLVIFFVLLSNLTLLKNKKFWLASSLAIFLFLPHLYWQYLNDFPSFRYHLSERGKQPYSINNTLMHFVNQIAIVGITFPIIYAAFFRKKPNSHFEKSLIFIVYGLIIFFFVSSFSTKPQAQWTGAILIPLILLTFSYFLESKKARKWLVILGCIQFIILLVARIFLANENVSPIVLEPHKSAMWVQKLKEKTKEKPIVFVNSYRNASVYNFYTGIKTHSYSTLKGRKSHYDFLDFEKQMQHKNVYATGSLLEEGPVLFTYGKKQIHGIAIENYTTFQKITCTIEDDPVTLSKNKRYDFNITITNTYEEKINLEPLKFIGVFQGKKNKILAKVTIRMENLFTLKAHEVRVLQASFVVPEINEDTDELTFRIGIDFYNLSEGYQGNKVKIKYEN